MQVEARSKATHPLRQTRLMLMMRARCCPPNPADADDALSFAGFHNPFKKIGKTLPRALNGRLRAPRVLMMLAGWARSHPRLRNSPKSLHEVSRVSRMRNLKRNLQQQRPQALSLSCAPGSKCQHRPCGKPEACGGVEGRTACNSVF